MAKIKRFCFSTLMVDFSSNITKIVCYDSSVIDFRLENRRNFTMMKPLITTAAALALLAAPVMNHKADAAGLQTNINNNVVKYEYKTNNIQDLETWVNSMLKQYNFNTAHFNIQPGKQTNNNVPKVTQNTAPTKKVNTNTKTTTTPKTNTTASTKQTSYQLSAYEKQVVDLTNQQRQKYGLPALKINTTLSKMAHTKANDMAVHHYFDHTSPTYGFPFDMMKKFGITYRAAGENIAMGQKTPQEVVNGWMNSPGHRANILNKNYTEIGAGFVANGNYWTQEFIGK